VGVLVDEKELVFVRAEELDELLVSVETELLEVAADELIEEVEV
jgi:hypothetical protein